LQRQLLFSAALRARAGAVHEEHAHQIYTKEKSHDEQHVVACKNYCLFIRTTFMYYKYSFDI
jgi:hypothetical protein